ncbi:MAG: diguanylate cyclase [Clostridia bacterium]|nr:diguanylate cyclase [Clostridia bacterium]
MFLIGGVCIFTLGREAERNMAEKLTLTSENVQRSIDAYLDGLAESVEVAARYAINSLDSATLTEGGFYAGKGRTEEQAEFLDAYLKQHCSEVRHLFGTVANYTSGVDTYYYCIAEDVSSSVHGFYYSKVGHPAFEKQPELVASELDPADTDGSAWYFTSARTGDPAWVGPYMADFGDELLTLSYTVPVKYNGRLVGVMGMDILFKTLEKKLNSVKVYETGYACLLAEDGAILYHPQFKIGTQPSEASKELNERIFGTKNSGSETIRYTSGGRERQLAFSTLTNGMKLCVSAPVDEINASWRQLISIILIIGATIVVAVTVMIFVIMKAMTKPLLELSSASQKLASGEYDVKLDYKGDDEVGVLTSSFRRMRDHLKLYISDLNSRAYTDALTGVKNKGAFSISAARLNDKILADDDVPEFAVAMFDCNRLKRINDEYGHECGDQYLKTACQTICRTFVHSPVFRMGGDEFCVILQKQDYENRAYLMEQFDVNAKEMNDLADEPWMGVNLSRGIADFVPEQDPTVEHVLRRADELMYEDKKMYKLAHRQ